MKLEIKTGNIMESHLVKKVDGCGNLFAGIIEGEFLLIAPGYRGTATAIVIEAGEITNLNDLLEYLFCNDELRELPPVEVGDKIKIPFAILTADSDIIGKLDCQQLPGTNLFFYASHILSAILSPRECHTDIVLCSASFVEPKTLTLTDWDNRISQYLSHTYCIRIDGIIDNPPGTVASLYHTQGMGPFQRFELFRTDNL